LSSLERDHVPSPRPVAAKEVPLVDRVEEMNALKQAVYRAVHGEGGLFFIHGEAGIGKTRLLREVGAYAQSCGVQVLQGRCPALFRMDGVPPYVIWKEVIKDYLETCTPEQLYRVIGYYPAEVAKLVPELSLKLRVIPQSLPISPDQEQNRLFEAVSQFITNISKETPLLVVLDDLQWTDPSSLLLLHYLARGTQKTPLLLLGAYRSTDVDAEHPLSPVLTELKRECLPQSVSVKRMSLKDTSEMIRQILEQDDIQPEFCQMIFEKTRGNPFFTGEVIESLKEEDVIYREEGMWKFKEISAIEFPETVKNVLKARLSRLDDECQNVLTLASFIGNDFTCEALRGVSGIEENRLLELIEKLLKTGLVKHRVVRGEDVCSFADILVRDVVYEEVSPFRRKKLHKTVGNVLEKAYAKKIDEHFGELALHFLEGGEKDKALDYFLKASQKAQKIYANNEAASYYQSALKLLEEKEGELQERGCVLEKLGDIKGIIGEPDARLNYLTDALLLWTLLNDKEKVARLHRRISYVFYAKGDKEKAREHLDKASEILENMPENVELALLYVARAGEKLWYAGDMAGSRSWAEKAVALAEKLNDSEATAESCLSLGDACMGTEDLGKAVECFEKALEIALEKNYVPIALSAYNELAVIVPKAEKRIEYLEKAYELAKKAGMIGSISWFGSMTAILYGLYPGDMERAVPLAEESITLSRKIGLPRGLGISLAYLGWIQLILGESEKAEPYLKEAFDLLQKAGDSESLLESYYLCGLAYFEKEEYAEARKHLEKSHEVLEKAFTLKYLMAFLVSQCLVCTYVELGEFEKAESLIESLRKTALEVKNDEFVANVDALTAMMFRAQKRWKESIEYFEKSLEEHEALNARQWDIYEFATNLFEYARLYLERNGEGDREKALNLLNQALKMFQRVGAKRYVEKAEAGIAFIETGRVVSKPKPIELVSTGYADLDKLLYGGIHSSCAVALTSPACNERDILVKGFLEAGAKKGEATFYVTINPGSAKTLAEEYHSNFCLFVCNPQAGAIVKDAPNLVKLKGVENLTDISIALTSAIRKLDPSLKGARRICIGLVSDVLLQHHAVQTRRWLAGLIPELQSEGFTTLAVMDPEMHPPQEVRAVLDLFEGEINIFEKETGLEKYLKIKKMSNQKYLENELLLKKEPI
jgi:tetratricopeptide (TPR) repeat protein